jgi:hypothetical protein
MRLLLIVLLFSGLVGCQGLSPKGIGLDIQFLKAPTAEEAKQWRMSQKWRPVKRGWVNERTPVSADGKQQVLINGTPVDKAKYPQVVRITSASGAGCTATIVHTQTIITAAHCAKTGEKVTFKTFDGRSWSALMHRYENWSDNDDLDIAVGRVNAPITGIKPVSIRTDRFEKVGMLVDMIGYGCINPGGGGGNDGILRGGKAQVTKDTTKFKYDLVTNGAPPDFSALCSGDSGGPVMYEGLLIGINSKGNLQDKNYTTRTTVADSKAWLEKISATFPMCGVSADCGGGTIPPPGPEPRQFVCEDPQAGVKIQGVIQ